MIRVPIGMFSKREKKSEFQSRKQRYSRDETAAINMERSLRVKEPVRMKGVTEAVLKEGWIGEEAGEGIAQQLLSVSLFGIIIMKSDVPNFLSSSQPLRFILDWNKGEITYL